MQSRQDGCGAHAVRKSGRQREQAEHAQRPQSRRLHMLDAQGGVHAWALGCVHRHSAPQHGANL